MEMPPNQRPGEVEVRVKGLSREERALISAHRLERAKSLAAEAAIVSKYENNALSKVESLLCRAQIEVEAAQAIMKENKS